MTAVDRAFWTRGRASRRALAIGSGAFCIAMLGHVHAKERSPEPMIPTETPGEHEEASAEVRPEPRMETREGDEDELLLLGGGFIRGRITEIEPGVRVTILPVGREVVRDVSWFDIEAIRRASRDAPERGEPEGPPVASNASPPPERTEVPVKGPFIRIEVHGGRDVSLNEVFAEATAQRTFGSDTTYAALDTVVCRSPCNTRVPVRRSALHVIKGPGVAPSRQFHLPPGDRITLDVRPRPKQLRPIGYAVTPLAGGLAVAGALMLSLNARASELGGEELTRATTSYRTAGGVLLGVGIGALVGGVVMIVTGRTRVDVR